MSRSTGAPPARRWRPSLRSLAYGPWLAQLVVTRRCNIDCGYCNEYDKSSEPVPTATVKSWIDKLAELRTAGIELTGGETLLHPDIVELVRYATDRGALQRWIITNGYLLSADLIDRLNDAGLTHLQVSVDGVDPTPTTVKVLKPLRKKLELLARRARFTVQLNAVFGATTPREAVEVSRFARDQGFRPRVCVIHDGHGAMSLDADGAAALREVQAAVGSRWREAHDYRSRLMEEGRAPFKCRAGARYLYVDEFGLVNWCSQQRGVFTKPLLDYGWADLREQFYTRKECAPTCTIGCVRSTSQYDEWRAQPHAAPARQAAPAVNEAALVPISALLGRAAAGRPRRSQVALRAARPPRPA